MRIIRHALVTGFEPFGGHGENPSALVAAALNGKSVRDVEIAGVVLPVTYAGSITALENAVRAAQPDALVMTGLAARRQAISIELYAWPHAGPFDPDESGAVPDDWAMPKLSPVPLAADVRAVAPLKDIPVPAAHAEFSVDPGRYVCNWVYFHALARILPVTAPSSRLRAVFVHLPPLPPAGDAGREAALATMTGYVEQAASELAWVPLEIARG